MSKDTSKQKTDAKEALELLEQAWAYYVPEPVKADKEPELFEYANAA
ncbi:MULTISPECIES: hypothetical protein [unclassified Ruegeria]|nr:MULTISPECIES: hypothetical protein [unclassified Ruegeria]NOG07705.1 hypothetical protein [Ruegeria sp. HKCCD4315]